MIQEFKQKTVYDFLHLFFSGHLKREDLAQGIKDYMEETPEELRVRLSDNIGLLQDTFIDVLFEVLMRYEPEYEKWEDEHIMRTFAAHHKVSELNDQKHKQYFTIKEASELLEKHVRTIHNYFGNGKLKREFINKQVYVNGNSLRKLMPNLKLVS